MLQGPYHLLHFLVFLPLFFQISHSGNSTLSPKCLATACSIGGVTIKYPFRLGDTTSGDFCGYLEFGLTCVNGEPVIAISGDSYYVKSINYDNNTITVMDMDFPLLNQTCPRLVHNLTIDDLPLDIPHNLDLKLSFYFNCTSSSFISTFSPDSIDCLRSGENESYVIVVGNQTDAPVWYGKCDENVVTAVKRSEITSYAALASEYGGAISQGVVLEWRTTKYCGACEASGGLCGHNRTTDVWCFCRDGSSPSDQCHDKGLCTECAGSGGSCGYNTSIERFVCHCPHDKAYDAWSCRSAPAPAPVALFSLAPSPFAETERGKHNDLPKKLVTGRQNHLPKKLVTGIPVGLVLVLIPIIIFCLYKKISRVDDKEKDIETFITNCGPLALKRYCFKDIKKMTTSFKEKLGEGGYGSVYKGKLLDGRLVAVKVLNVSKAKGEEFLNEVASIGKTSHVNVVTLLGFCFEPRKRVLVYEFMPNGSLDKFIRSRNAEQQETLLEWQRLDKIAIGVARGLEYLHRGCNTKIVHFDIKPHNILLDEDFCPKISDFGLAKLSNREESSISLLEARGTIGYIAPEVFTRNIGGVSSKSDVYSYGMMLLDMVGGRQKGCEEEDDNSESTYFPHWIYKRLELGKHEVHGSLNIEDTEVVRKLTIVGLWCIQTIPSNRPSISQVIEMLEGSVEALKTPPKPSFSPSQRPEIYSSSTSIASM